MFCCKEREGGGRGGGMENGYVIDKSLYQSHFLSYKVFNKSLYQSQLFFIQSSIRDNQPCHQYHVFSLLHLRVVSVCLLKGITGRTVPRSIHDLAPHTFTKAPHTCRNKMSGMTSPMAGVSNSGSVIRCPRENIVAHEKFWRIAIVGYSTQGRILRLQHTKSHS